MAQPVQHCSNLLAPSLETELCMTVLQRETAYPIEPRCSRESKASTCSSNSLTCQVCVDTKFAFT